MKLAIVRQTHNPNGGAERFISRTLNVLTKDSTLDITLIARQWEDADGWKILIVNPPFRSRITRESKFAAKATTYFSKFDIVQSHERIPGATIFRAGDGVHATWLEKEAPFLSPIARKVKLFSPYHRYILQTEEMMFTHPNLRKVICNSKMVRDDIAHRFTLPEKVLTVIYNGVDTFNFSPKVRSRSQRSTWCIPKNVPVLAYVGSGFRRKGLAIALQAIIPHPTVWLVIAGRDKHVDKFKRLAQKIGVSSRVRFLGPIEDVREVYGSSDALILPTLYDPFPNVCIEAMSCGLPVLTSHSCGAAEWIEDGKNGWVCDELNTDSYQKAIEEWLKGSEQNINYSAFARATAEPHTLDRMAKELMTLYRELLH